MYSFKTKHKKPFFPIWLLPLMGLMTMLVILLASYPGVAGAQGEDRWAGTVVDQDGKPVAAIITINGRETRATDNGSFELYVEQDSENRYLINAKMTGYALYSQVHVGWALESMAITLNRAEVFTIDPLQPIEVEDERGTLIEIPAKTLVDANGNPATSPLNLLLYTFDIEAGEMPGDMTALDREGNLVTLESSGAFFAEFQDSKGNMYNLAPDAKARISVPVSDALPKAPDTIQLWSYNEAKGLWIEEGEATQSNGRYVGNVSHFSAWNFDLEFTNPACIKLTVDPIYLALNAPLSVRAEVYYPPSTTPVQVKYLSVTQTTNVLYALPANPPTNAEVRFYIPDTSTTLYATVLPGAAWGGTGIPPFPYNDCNGTLHINGGAQLSCANAQGYPGEQLSVNLTATGNNVYGIQSNVTSDPAIAQPQSATFGTFFTSPYAVGINQSTPTTGEWAGAISQQNPNPPVTGSGTFATIVYQAINPGSTSLSINQLFSDRDGFVLPSTVSNCTLTVLPFGRIGGIVTYQGRLTHANIQVVATGAVTNNDLTDSSGNFEINNLQGGNYQVTADVASYLPACAANVTVNSGQITNLPNKRLLGGDVNDDVDTALIINIGDFTRLAANFNQPASADSQADINADNMINIQDLTILSGNYGISGCQSW